MTAPKKPEVVTRTTFFAGEGDQWFWETKSLTNEVIADGGEGYPTLRECIAGYFQQQNIPYGIAEKWPSNYGPLQRLQETQYQINKFITN